MKPIKLNSIKILSFVLLFSTLTTAQVSVNTSGGDAAGTSGSIAYSVGQVFISTYMNNSGSVSQGVQQPYEVSVVLSDNNPEGIDVNLSVFPNPTSNYITLSINALQFIKNQLLTYQLYDTSGKILQSNRINKNTIVIYLEPFESATYFLRVLKSNKELKTFKLIKN